jgi:Fic family protein
MKNITFLEQLQIICKEGVSVDKFQILTNLKNVLDTYRPLPPEAVKNLQDVYRVEWTYHSNAIEGNTLSLVETKLVLEEGITIGGKQLREHLEVINHSEAISFVEEQIINQKDLTEYILKNIHYLVLKNIDDKNAGTYRSINVGISGSQHTPPHFLQVPEAMKELFTWYAENTQALHPVELAALFHFKFVFIHPFADGNGRTARLLLNLILMQNGYPPIIIKADPKDRLEYYTALEKASVDNDLKSFLQLIIKCTELSLKRYIGAVK